jgi:serine/threonine-protein kinase
VGALLAELTDDQPATVADARAADPDAGRDLAGGPAAENGSGAALGGASTRPHPAFEPGFRFLADWRRYRVEGFLGAGGMGSVFKAYDPSLNRHVAIKFLHRNEPAQTQQFVREARSQARVDHPNVCRVYEVGEVEGRPYITMQFVAGQSLVELGDALSVAAQVRLVRDVARAVHAAHRTGLIHRDLKPGNILVSRGEGGELVPHVVDFGLARDAEDVGMTRPGAVTGTPAYLSPEQALAKPLDRRTDVYSLGVVLYELLGGRPPFKGDNPPQTLVRLIQDEAVPLSRLNPAVPRDLETIVMKCLEKEPGRRYDSARAFAEDLDRWLEGDPIAARPAGWAYRFGKKVGKNRPLAAVVAGATVALLALGAVSLANHLRAQETAELAQRFGQKSKEVEDSMRLAALLPRHDITPEKDDLRRQLEGIEDEMARLGPLAAGPGHAALGRGYLALHQYERARDHLERAWEVGHRTPDVAAALGRVMGLLYERALVDASPSRNPELGSTAREEIERTLKQPALSYLKEGSAGEGGASPYLAGLIAFYEGRYDDSLALAREAQGRAPPWLYEGEQLEAEIRAVQGDDAEVAGRYAEAVALYDRAREVYRRLLARAPSDPTLYSADCGVQIRRLEVEAQTGSIGAAGIRAALATCDLALEVDPELVEALQHEARLHWRWAEQQAHRGEDPRPELAEAVAICRRIIALNPAVATAHGQLSVAYRLLATWQMGRGIDPGEAFAAAAAAAATAVELEPDLATGFNSLGNVHHELARHQLRTGADPGDAIERARAAFRRAIDLNPRYATPHTNLGNCWKMLAEYRMARGLDPTEALDLAVAALERAAELKPSSPAAHNNLGNAHLTRAELQASRGSDPRQALERAAGSYRRAIGLNPQYGLAHYNLAYTLRSLAEYLLGQGGDVDPPLAEADRALDRAVEINPGDSDGFLERARVDLVAARRALARGADPAAELAAAAAALDRAHALNPREPEVFLARAIVARHRAEWTAARGGDPGPAIRSGLAMAAEAAAISPLGGRSRAIEGTLRRLAAESAADPGRRREQAGLAVAALEEALQANPLLSREYGPALARARALAAGG